MSRYKDGKIYNNIGKENSRRMKFTRIKKNTNSFEYSIKKIIFVIITFFMVFGSILNTINDGLITDNIYLFFNRVILKRDIDYNNYDNNYIKYKLDDIHTRGESENKYKSIKDMIYGNWKKKSRNIDSRRYEDNVNNRDYGDDLYMKEKLQFKYNANNDDTQKQIERIKKSNNPRYKNEIPFDLRYKDNKYDDYNVINENYEKEPYTRGKSQFEYSTNKDIINDDPKKQIEEIYKSDDVRFKDGVPLLDEDKYNNPKCGGGYLDNNNMCKCPPHRMGENCNIKIDKKFACLGDKCFTGCIEGGCDKSFAILTNNLNHPRTFGDYDYVYNGYYCKAACANDNRCYCTVSPKIQIIED